MDREDPRHLGGSFLQLTRTYPYDFTFVNYLMGVDILMVNLVRARGILNGIGSVSHALGFHSGCTSCSRELIKHDERQYNDMQGNTRCVELEVQCRFSAGHVFQTTGHPQLVLKVRSHVYLPQRSECSSHVNTLTKACFRWRKIVGRAEAAHGPGRTMQKRPSRMLRHLLSPHRPHLPLISIALRKYSHRGGLVGTAQRAAVMAAARYCTRSALRTPL